VQFFREGHCSVFEVVVVHGLHDLVLVASIVLGDSFRNILMQGSIVLEIQHLVL